MLERIEQTRRLLQGPLPGAKAHSLVMSYLRDDALAIRRSGRAFKEGAVLFLLYPHNNTLQTALILRPEYEGVHSGQIAFPGGRREKEDADLSHTALREAREEVGLISDEVELIGRLSEVYIPPSNYIVRPYVAYTHKRPEFVPDPREVQRVLEYDIEYFLHTDAIRNESVLLSGGARLKVGAFNQDGHVIWGATAMMISEFRMLLNEDR